MADFGGSYKRKLSTVSIVKQKIARPTDGLLEAFVNGLEEGLDVHRTLPHPVV